MSLEKATFVILDKLPAKLPSSFSVQYNPKSYSGTHQSNFLPHKSTGKKDGEQEYASTSSPTISMELYFDTTHDHPLKNVMKAWVKPFIDLTRACVPLHGEGQMEKVRPPRVQFIWGSEVMIGHVTSVSYDCTMFSERGVPIRACVKMSMTESEPPKDKRRYKGPLSALSADRCQLVVHRAGTINAIAAEYGLHPRQLLEDNRHLISDPMNIPAGLVLLLRFRAWREAEKKDAKRRKRDLRWL